MDKMKRKKELGRLMASVRVSHCVSQEEMAAVCDVSRGTVAHWESGTSNPDIFQLEDWFDYLGEDPIYYLSWYRNPEIYAKHDLGAGKHLEDLIHILRTQAPALVIRQLHFLASGAHGSNRDAFMQELCAVLQLPLYMRHALAQMASSMYKLALANGKINCPEEVQPDIELLDNAIAAGYAAAANGGDGYILHGGK